MRVKLTKWLLLALKLIRVKMGESTVGFTVFTAAGNGVIFKTLVLFGGAKITFI